jgi:hypothetical protein
VVTALVDSGSDKCLLPLSVIPVSHHKHITPSNMTFSGCGKIQAVGTITVYLQSSYSNWKSKNVEFYVVRESLPPIIGKSFFMEHAQIKPDLFKIHGAGLEMFLKDGKKIVFPWTNNECQMFLAQPIKIQESSTEEKIGILAKEKQIKLTQEVFKGENFKKLVDLLWNKKHVFKGSNDPIGEFTETAKIPTIPGLTKAVRPRPIPKHLQPQVKAEIDRMLENGVIEKCEDGKGFHSPLVLVPKKSGKIRLCSDFKGTLNKVLTENTEIWSLPMIDNLFSDIEAGCQIFSDLDVNSAYWNIIIAEEDRYKTNFLFNDHLYQYVRMPFGLRHSGDCFNKAIAKMLDTVKLKNSFKSYVDDILCHTKDEATHLEVIGQVLEACEKFGARLGGEKCHFGRRATKFMGREISSEGISIPKENMEALMNLQPPKTRKELMSVLGSFC